MSLLLQQSRTGWKHYKYGGINPRASLRRRDNDELDDCQGQGQKLLL